MAETGEDLAGLSIPIEASTALLREQMEQAAQVVGTSTDRIDRSLGKVDKAFDRLDAASRAVKRAMGNVTKEMQAAESGLTNSADKIDRRLGVLGKGTNTASRAADMEAWGRELDRLEAKFDPVATAARRMEAEIEDLNAAQRAGIVDATAYGQQLQRIKAQYDPATIAARKLREEAEKEAASLQVLVDRLDKTGAAARKAAADQELLNKALAAKLISPERHAALSSALRDQSAATQEVTSSTKLASHEITNLTYQLQDAAVQLAGGQNPFLILMQQGPQATGAVGGVGRALSLLATPMGMAVLGVTAVAGAVALVTAAAEKHEKSVLQVTTSTRLMGDAVGLTGPALEDMAQRAADAGQISVTAARDQESAYIRTGRIGGETMERLIGLSRDYAAATQQDVDKAKSELADLFTDPVHGAERLQAAYGILTAKEMEHVRQLKATGQEEEARVQIAEKLGARVRGLADNTTTFAQAWERVGRAVSNAFDAVGEATAPETNAQALKRLEERRKALQDRLTQQPGGGTSLLGGLLSKLPFVGDLKDGVTGAVRDRQSDQLAEVEAEIGRRRAVEARAREQAAILKDTRDRDRFQNEAADITRAARPLGSQIDEVTEKVTKLRRAFGEDMAGASDVTKKALAGFEEQLKDLKKAEDDHLDLDAYKRKRQAEVTAQAATMVGPSREKFLAEKRQEIDLIGTATSATERQTQVEQAGAAATASATQAATQQSAQTEAAIRGTVSAAEAYRTSLADGIAAEARRQAQSEAVTSAIDVEARTRQLVVEKAGQEALSLSQLTAQLDLETDAQEKVVAATDDGVAARMEAERVAQVAKTTSVALAAAQAAEKAGNAELAKKLRELAIGYDEASRKAAGLSKIDTLKQFNQQQRDGIDQLKVEAGIVSDTADDRERVRAAYAAEVKIRQSGIDVSKQLTAEERRQVEETRKLAAEAAELQIATNHTRDAWKGVGDAIDAGIVRPLESAVDAIVKGQGETIKWGNLLKGAAASLAGDAFKMGVINPVKNELGFEHSASLWDLPIFGGGGEQKVIRNKDGSTSFAPASQGVGGSWLSQPVFPERNAQDLFDAGQSGSWQNGKWESGQSGWFGGSPTWGNVIAGIGGIAAGTAMATQKGATAGQKIGGGLMGVGGAVMMIPGGFTQIAGGVMMAAGALLSAVSGAKDRGEKYSISHVTLGPNGKYALGRYDQDNDGDPTRFNADAQKLAKGLNDIASRLNLTATVGDTYIDSKSKSAEQAALEALKGMKSGVPEVAYALAHETSASLEDALKHLEFAQGFDVQIQGIRSSISDLFEQFQTGVAGSNSLARTLLDLIDNSQTVFVMPTGSDGFLPPTRGYQVGTSGAAPGWAWVGEAGPELVRFAGGETVIPHERSVRLAMSMGRLPGYEDGTDGEGDQGEGPSGGGPGSATAGNENAAHGENHGSTAGRDASYGGDWGGDVGGGGGIVGAITGLIDQFTGWVANQTGVPAGQIGALVGTVGVTGTAVVGGLLGLAQGLGAVARGLGIDGTDAPAGTGGETAGSGSEPGLIQQLPGTVATQLLDLLRTTPAASEALVGKAQVGPVGGELSIETVADGRALQGIDDPRAIPEMISEVSSALVSLRDAAVPIPPVLQRAADQLDAVAAARGIPGATDKVRKDAVAAQEAAYTRFEGAGLTRQRVDELNAVVKSLGDNTFTPIGKDFDQLAADMRKAAGVYTAAGEKVPESLFAATRQMEALGAVKKRLLDEVAGTTVETSPEEKKVEQLKGAWSSTATDLVKAFASVGIAGDDLTRKLNEGLQNALKKERTDYGKTLDTSLRKVRGQEGYDSAVTLVEGFQTSMKDIAALWPEGQDRMQQVGKAMDIMDESLLGLVKSGSITSKSLEELQQTYSDQPAVLLAVEAALKELQDTEARQIANSKRKGRLTADKALDVSSYETVTASSLLADAGVTKDLGDFTTDLTNFTTALARGTATAADARYVFDRLDHQLETGAITGDQYNALVRDISQSWTDAQARRSAIDSFNAGVGARYATAIGADVWSTTMKFDQEAARQRTEAWNTGVRGTDLMQLERVLGFERVQTVAKARQQELLTAYDQQIRGLQTSSAAAREFVQEFGQAIKSIRQARKDWLVGDSSPLPPGEQKATLETQVAETFAKAMGGDAEALAAIVPLLEKRNALEAEQTAKTDRTLFDDSLAKLAALDDKFGPQLDASEKAVKIADDTLKAVQQERDAVSHYGERQITVTEELKASVLSGFADVATAVRQLDGTGTGSTTTGTSQAATKGAWMTEWFGRYNSLLADMDSGRVTAEQAQATGTALWQEKNNVAAALPSDPAVWNAVITAAAASAHGSDTATWFRQLAHDRGVPGFWAGGQHQGGLRIVGERGPEIEATGPARIWTADQIATAMAAARGELGPTVVPFLPAGLGGGKGMAEVVRAVDRLGDKIDRLLDETEAGNRDGAHQLAAVGEELSRDLGIIQAALVDVPKRIAAARL